MESNLFNYKETRELNELREMVKRLSKEIALTKLDLNNFKRDFENYKRAKSHEM